MKRVFKMQDLDCANCAAKIENGISKLEGVDQVNVNFIAQKMTLSAVDDKFEMILEEAQRIVKKIEPDCRIIV